MKKSLAINYFRDLLDDVKNLFQKKETNVAPINSVKINKNNDWLNQKGSYQNPVPGAKNSGNFDPTGNGSVGAVHKGTDLRASGGTPIYPITKGIVSSVKKDTLGGNTITIEHPNNVKSYYAHCGTILVKPGQRVDNDTQIATVGDTGNAKGFPHLHLQTWVGGSLVDPRSLFSFEGQSRFDKTKEKLWLPGAKEVANNWNINDHLKNDKLA